MYKRKSVKEVVNPLRISCKNEISSEELSPGPRADNEWCRYSEKNIPKDEKSWNEPRFLYGKDSFIGYYGWPTQMKVYSSPSVQPVNLIKPDEFDDVGKVIDSFFIDLSNVEKIIYFINLDDHYPQSRKLRSSITSIFKYVMKVHESRYFDVLKSAYENLLTKSESDHNVSHRCIAEIFAGMVFGTKLWTFNEAQKFQKWCCPLLKRIIDKIVGEDDIILWRMTMRHIFVFCNVNKYSYLFDVVTEDLIKNDVVVIARLRIAISISVGTWRIIEYYNKLLNFIKPHLTTDSNEMRTCLSLILANAFYTDRVLDKMNSTSSRFLQFLDGYILPKLKILDMALYPDLTTKNDGNITTLETLNYDDDEIKQAINLLHTVTNWTEETICKKSLCIDNYHFYKLYPLFCIMENHEKNIELMNSCDGALTDLSEFKFSNESSIPLFLEAFEKVSNSNSWCAKVTNIEFLLCFSFNNIFFLFNQPKWVDKILSNTLKLIVDQRCEVRTKAGLIISGFMHYDLIADKKKILEIFYKYCRSEDLNVKHGGVIGLCAFVCAYTYKTPPEDILIELGKHLNDHEPIPSTIITTLNDLTKARCKDWQSIIKDFRPELIDLFSNMQISLSHYS